MVYIERYFGLVREDIQKVTDDLSQSMPTQLRVGLEGELRRLQMLEAALRGELDKSTLHQLRANLRWARVRLDGDTKQGIKPERDPDKRKKLTRDISNIEAEIKKEVERVWERK